MGAPQWWSTRRFGMLINTSLATVPAWAPIGQDAAWYCARIDRDTSDLNLQPTAMPEALRHHRERWAHIEHYDDFLPFLHFDEFDPDAWAGLARDAGMGYAVLTAKHHDGLCWWDAPGSDRTVLHDGPARNVLGLFASAAERADLVFGTAYSLLDWADPRYPGPAYVSEVLHPQILDLVDRYGTMLLWGDGQWGAGPDHWRSDELIAAARAIRPDIAVNDRWFASDPDVRTLQFVVPDRIVTEPWEFRRPLGSSGIFNRAETDEQLMTAREIVDLLTEVIAKGGHLLIEIGPDAAGVMPAAHAERLRAAGGWIRRHAELIDRGTPWTTWGDAHCRYLDLDGVLHAIDVSGQGRFAALTFDVGKAVAITATDGTSVSFDQTDDGVQLSRPPRKAQRLPAVYRLDLEAPLPPPIELFAPVEVSPTELAPLLRDARPGSIVQLGEGIYLGPARVPDGVTVRGLGPTRTTIDGLESPALVLGADSRLEHCRTVGGGVRIGRLPRVSVELIGDGASMLGCDVVGHIAVRATGSRVTSCSAAGVVASGANRVEVWRCTLTGIGHDTGIEIDGGAGHLIDSCEINGHMAAIELRNTVGASVRHCRLRARSWGVRLIDTEAADVTANALEYTMRAIDVDGGTDARITGNAAADGDSGCLVQRGAANAQVSGNYWERCRVGLVAWGAGDVRARDNNCSDLGEPDGASIVGP